MAFRRGVILSSLAALAACGGHVDGASGGRDAARDEAPGAPCAASESDVADTGTAGGGAGSCDPACAGTCIEAGCLETLATMQYEPGAIAVDATHVFWGNFDESVMRAGLDGGSPVSLVISQAVIMATDGMDLYWTDPDQGELSGGGMGSIEKVPIVGGGSTTLASGPPFWPLGLAIDDRYVYWTDQGNSPCDSGLCGSVRRVLKSGGATITMAAGLDRPAFMAVDAASVYWVSSLAGTIMKLPLSGGVPITLASGQDQPVALAVDATSVYWANAASDCDAAACASIVKVSLCGGSPVTLAANQIAAGPIAIDATNVYWGGLSESAGIMSVPLGGGVVTTLVPSVFCTSIAVGGGSIYWTTSGSPLEAGMVQKLTPR